MAKHMIHGLPAVFLTIAADTADYNIFTAAGGIGSRVDVVVTIASGIVVYQSAGLAAFRTGIGWAAGSTLRLINNGYIVGLGGTGGDGGVRPSTPGGNGSTGGDALRNDSTTIPFTVDNTNGYIFGAGGGGGGAGTGPFTDGVGGGGGRGRIDGPGGAGGGTADDGTAGTFAAKGLSGAAGGYVYAGDGGDWGESGGTGTTGQVAGGSGGAAGKAVNLNAAYITWAGGNNAAQVKGALV